ncbi:hypothetical protein AgCh_030590 [Apium graveolens]
MLAYGAEAVVPLEITRGSPKVEACEPETNEVGTRLTLDLVDEQEDLILRKIEASGVGEKGKLAPNWEGAYKVKKTLGRGSHKLNHWAKMRSPKPLENSELSISQSEDVKTRDFDKLKTSISQTQYGVLEISISLCTYRDVKCSISLNWRSREKENDDVYQDGQSTLHSDPQEWTLHSYGKSWESTDGDMVIQAYYAPKDPAEYFNSEKEKVSLDSSLQLILIESLDNVMYNNIVKCDTAKKIWEKIEILCEGIEEVRSNQRRILILQYEGFMAKPKESIIDVFERFDKLINDLQLHDKYYEAEEVNLKFLLTHPDHLEQKISAIREGRDLSRITLEVLYGILKTYELEMIQRQSLRSGQGHVVDGSRALIVNEGQTSNDGPRSHIPVASTSHFAIECRKPKKAKKDKAYLELEVKYEALLKKQQSKAYIAEGKSWDGSKNDEDEELGKYALMALEQGESSSSKSQQITKLNEKLESEKQEVELLTVELAALKQKNGYLKNKLREKLEKSEVKLKSFKNASELVGQYHEKNKPCANIAIGLDYDTLTSKKKNTGDRGEATKSENVPAMLKNVGSPMLKTCEVNFSEEELIIKQEIVDEDNKNRNTNSIQSSKAEENLMDNQSTKTHVKETKIEDTRKKKKIEMEEWG